MRKSLPFRYRCVIRHVTGLKDAAAGGARYRGTSCDLAAASLAQVEGIARGQGIASDDMICRDGFDAP